LKDNSVKDLAKIRNDVVGSLLRPERLKRAHEDYDDGKIEIGTLREIEDQQIRQAVRLQERLGLAVVTDGEFRRLNFQDSFAASVAGYDAAKASVSVYEHRVKGSHHCSGGRIPAAAKAKVPRSRCATPPLSVCA
jgi:5-methyltetrahydropteroyltriglutamate--homocysteine methyltransferase